ncbi:OLC1v1030743C1 [Oldenlandia corymbosa var. corymbosa]|uniref:OLC1v1030743C1 n=1 Tax=Oldenlandia corymbosa var. corymbosa TaxID=529605 RepID=A0AAV1CHK4_OLDCO|nr:OLC1v1030743C1 [Oldenlandia corymbosa var. corymbosa]
MVPNPSLMVGSGTRDLRGRKVYASARAGDTEDVSQMDPFAQSHIMLRRAHVDRVDLANSSQRLDKVFDQTCLDQENVIGKDNVPFEDFDSKGYDDFEDDTLSSPPPVRPPSVVKSPPSFRPPPSVRPCIVVRLPRSAFVSSSSSVSSAGTWFVTTPVKSGPQDSSVILSFLGHVAHLLTEDSHKNPFKMDTRITYFKSLKDWKGAMETEGKNLLERTELSHIVDIMYNNIDQALITAFVKSLTATGAYQSGGVQGKVVVEHCHTGRSARNQVIAWLWLMLGNILFTDRSRTRIGVAILSEIIEGLATCHEISWGSATLAYLYRQLGVSTRSQNASMSGCYTLLQAWIYEYFPSFRPSAGRASRDPAVPRAGWGFVVVIPGCTRLHCHADGDHRANTNGEGHVAANNGEDEQVEVVNANGGSKDAALKNTSYIHDPLSDIVGPMTRARRKRMDESLNSLITTTWAKEEIKLDDYKPKTINLLQVTPN